MIQTENFYWFGVSAAVYLTTCWMFAAVRWFHTCREPKDRHDYLYPDRKLLIVIYLLGTVLLPYLLDPTSPSAWTLWKSYFPGTYYFYSGSLFFCFFGTVRQWNQWKTVIWIAAVFTMAAMLPLVLDAWIPDGLLTANASNVWGIVVTVVGIVMMGYAAMALWLVWHWMLEARDENYSNPDDFPLDFARRVRLMPIVLTLNAMARLSVGQS